MLRRACGSGDYSFADGAAEGCGAANGDDVDVNAEDSMGRTPCDFAAIMGELKMMDFLMQHGGKCKLKNKFKKQCLKTTLKQ